ncbi:hypothetical protein LguiB_019314 [Lonicera macranthoides]
MLVQLKQEWRRADISWVQSLVKELISTGDEGKIRGPVSDDALSSENIKSNSQIEFIDHSVLGAWLEHMPLDQLVA